MKNLSPISACLLLGACGSTPAPLDSGLAAPSQWRYLAAERSDASDIASGGRPSARRNWTACCNARC